MFISHLKCSARIYHIRVGLPTYNVWMIVKRAAAAGDDFIDTASLIFVLLFSLGGLNRKWALSFHVSFLVRFGSWPVPCICIRSCRKGIANVAPSDGSVWDLSLSPVNLTIQTFSIDEWEDDKFLYVSIFKFSIPTNPFILNSFPSLVL